MEWNDDAIVLSVRPHGETSAIVETLTREHGRHTGLVRGGASRRVKAVLQPGNTLHAQWRARLSDHLGNFSLELALGRAGAMIESRDALLGLNAFTSVASAALPEREPHEPVYAAAEILLDAIMKDDFEHWAPLYVRWEAGLLHELGFGLDLSQCAATGDLDDLIYVSPEKRARRFARGGRSLSRAALSAAAVSAGLAERVADCGRHRSGLAADRAFPARTRPAASWPRQCRRHVSA